MFCPNCEHNKFEVLETRTSGDGIRRRRSCVQCGHRFTTFERIEKRTPLIIKKSGQRVPFSRDKVADGLGIACRKRPVSATRLDEAARRIEDQVVALGRNEIPSTEVGRLVLAELKEMDLVGYLRFASVYQEIESADEFLALLRPWVNPDEPRT
jgi:transcriptional repressor NrdR